MKGFEIRWKNFRCFEDSDWLEVRPITIILGSNASGKTSIITPLLMLKQTLASADSSLDLMTQGPIANVGSYENLVFHHDLERKLSLSFRFDKQSKKKNQNLKKVGVYPPKIVDINFCYNGNEAPPSLESFYLYDKYERKMLGRRLLNKTTYNLTGPNAPSKQGTFYNAIKRSTPDHFMFSAERAFHEKYLEYRKARARKDKSSDDEVMLQIDESTQLYFSIVTHIRSTLSKLLTDMSYIGPLRESARRLYEISGEKPSDVGMRGKFAPELLYRFRDRYLLDAVNEWVNEFGFGLRLKCNSLTEGAFNITLRRTNKSPEINLADTGFGLSQVFPIIVQGYFQEPNSLLIAEQPEIHLNPKLQARLADLFIDISKRDVSIIIETHSEHLLLRLRRLIAEGDINSKDVALYFVERDKDTSTIRHIPIEPDGHIKIDDWPKGFFEESLYDSLALASAQSRRK